MLNSLVIGSADRNSVPLAAHWPLTVMVFGRNYGNSASASLIEVVNEEIQHIPEEGIVVIATGPLTSPALSSQIRELMGEDYFYFTDAAAPIVEKDSIDMSKVYLASCYDKGEAAYLNCPMTEEEFDAFYDALINAEVAQLKEFEKEIYFEGRMPIEVMMKRGKQTALFGPMKPVGLVNPHTGKPPHAVVRSVRIMRQVPSTILSVSDSFEVGRTEADYFHDSGLENAEIVRYGVMHRNTFVNSPKLLEQTYQVKTHNPCRSR